MTITPGPWRARRFDHADGVTNDVDAPGIGCAPDCGDDERYSILEDLKEADARLIAAAPAMLELLRATLAWPHSERPQDECEVVTQKIEALLARIDGKDGEG